MSDSTAPTPLITLKDNKLVVHPTAAQNLAAIHTPLAVVAVAGVYRTGKSYILNQLAAASSARSAATQHGFETSPSVQACTKGIWMWGAPRSLPPAADARSLNPDEPRHLLLLDTEGLQSIEQTEGHDAKIFCLAILLSSFFIYNSESRINSAAIDQLSMVLQLARKIRLSGESRASTDELSRVFPQFLWLLRDFQLDLVDESGQEISTDRYLDDCLRPQTGSTHAVREQNETRRAISSLFASRSCLALPHPTLGTQLPQNALRNLPPLEQLAPGFRQGVVELRRRVLQSPALKVGGMVANGSMLLHLAESYCKAMNEGAMPAISTAWQSAIQLENERALTAAMEWYRSSARALLDGPSLTELEWLRQHRQLEHNALTNLRRARVGVGSEVEAELRKKMEEERLSLEKMLEKQRRRECDSRTAQLRQQLDSFRREAAPSAARMEELVDEVVGACLEQASAFGGEATQHNRAVLLELVACVRQAGERAVAQKQNELAAATASLQDKARELQDSKSEGIRELNVARAKLEEVQRARAASTADAERRAMDAERKQQVLQKNVDEKAALILTQQMNISQLNGQLKDKEEELSRMKCHLSAQQAQMDAARLHTPLPPVTPVAPPPPPPTEPPPPPPSSVTSMKRKRAVEPSSSVPDVDMEEEFESAVQSSRRRKSSLDIAGMSHGLLQQKLKQKLGAGYKLPKEKEKLKELARKFLE